MTITTLTFRQPDDLHVHLRDGIMLSAIAPFTTKIFGRAIVMPNLQKPITTIEAAIAYRQRIEILCKRFDRNNQSRLSNRFRPLMTVYLTEDLNSNELVRGHIEGIFTAAKLYPFNSTTNSAFGVKDIIQINHLLETMEKIGMPLLIHGEVIDREVDIFDREKIFIEKHLISLHKRFPNLKIVLEHITTADAVNFIESMGAQLAATITPHHLHLNRNAMFLGGLRSDFYCLPVLKRDYHRLALRRAATSGNPKFFLGTDSAPHLRKGKETSCGCAGIFNASHAIESYAQVFEEEGRLRFLEGFASEYGAKFYGLPLNLNNITLEKKEQVVPRTIHWTDTNGLKMTIVPLHAGETLKWSLRSQ